MDNCDTNSSEMKASLNGEDYEGEGYVLSDELQTIKLINRREFSYHNFIRNSQHYVLTNRDRLSFVRLYAVGGDYAP